MTWHRSIETAIKSLQREKQSLEKELERVHERIKRLEDVAADGDGSAPRAAKRRLSAEGREAISRAAKKRWREYRAERGTTQRRAKSS